jgi:hypothetical protein
MVIAAEGLVLVETESATSVVAVTRLMRLTSRCAFPLLVRL